jgi:hypothetical protein
MQTFLKGGGPDVTCDLFVERVRDNAAKMCRSEGGVPVKMVVFDYSPFAVSTAHKYSTQVQHKLSAAVAVYAYCTCTA